MSVCAYVHRPPNTSICLSRKSRNNAPTGAALCSRSRSIRSHRGDRWQRSGLVQSGMTRTIHAPAPPSPEIKDRPSPAAALDPLLPRAAPRGGGGGVRGVSEVRQRAEPRVKSNNNDPRKRAIVASVFIWEPGAACATGVACHPRQP